MKRASILKFTQDNKFVLYPINTLEGGGGRASSPYTIEKNLTYLELAKSLIDTLGHSIIDAPRILDGNAARKHHLKSVGVKTMKELHNGTLNIGIFTKNGKYYISPSVNKGSKGGFSGSIKDRIIIPESSSTEELATALKEAFAKSS